MIDKDTNAFPLPLGTANCAEPHQSGGMSLRDYFAAKAMQGFCAAAKRTPNSYHLEEAAKLSYEMADLMMKESSK